MSNFISDEVLKRLFKELERFGVNSQYFQHDLIETLDNVDVYNMNYFTLLNKILNLKIEDKGFSKNLESRILGILKDTKWLNDNKDMVEKIITDNYRILVTDVICENIDKFNKKWLYENEDI